MALQDTLLNGVVRNDEQSPPAVARIASGGNPSLHLSQYLSDTSPSPSMPMCFRIVRNSFPCCLPREPLRPLIFEPCGLISCSPEARSCRQPGA
ncbi:hypothetical protein GOP47_0015267 [Adiantum capillus-veneris]|uniref:Uncharacterized protein n=1 Tax=Adiantum capillus-veneris TaxID=13818 RepID=A0A9D4ZDV0_ADICA|nr:hypothetical protein GOP47_0015267 [Adiantum capillus-veneris]